MWSKTEISIVTPCYNDVPSFICLRDDIKKSLECLHIKSLNFVVVDDTGGIDPEVSQLRRLHDVTVVTPPFNLGHQRAIVYGLRQVQGQVCDDHILVTMDSDGEDRPEDLVTLLEQVRKPGNQNSVVLARRTKRSESIAFKVFYFFFKMFFKIMTGQIIRSGNFASFRAGTLKRFVYHPSFDLCYSSSLLATRLPKIDCPCPRGVRYKGQSKMNMNALIMHGIRMLMPFLDSIAIRSLMLFGATAFFGIGLGLIVLGVKLFTDLAIPGWASYTTLASLLLSAVGFGQFIIVFSLFTQITGSSLRFIDKSADQSHDQNVSSPNRKSS